MVSVRSITPDLGPGLQLESSIRLLTGPSPQGLDNPRDFVVLAGQAGLRPA